MSTLRLTTLSNQAGTSSVPSDTVISGSAKAWVNFNGTGTVAIRSSFNVSSITDNGTGNYTVNFINALADTNYAPIYYNEGGFDVMRYQSSGTQNTNNCQIRSGYISGSSLIQADIGTICAAFFR